MREEYLEDQYDERKDSNWIEDEIEEDIFFDPFECERYDEE